jgi:hypothetical protein
MRVYLSGGEKGSHRSLLISNDVKNIAVNVTQLAIPKIKEFTVPGTFGEASVLVYTSEGDEDVNRYNDFVRTHAEDISLVIGRPDMDGDWLGEKYVPVWSDDQDLERLAFICQKTGRVAISDKAINGKNVSRIRSLAQRWDAQLYGITSKVEIIEALPWEAVIVTSWTSTIRYGETQVWDGHGLRRYPAQQKESARRKHRNDIIRLGIEYEAILEDSVQDVGSLAIRSWQQYEERTFGAYDPSDGDDEEELSDVSNDEIIMISTETDTLPKPVSRGANIMIDTVEKRHEEDRILLPVIGIENVINAGSYTTSDQGESIEIDPEEIPVIRHNSSLLRQCNNCYLSSRCPAFKPNSECGFKLPVQITNKEQLMATLRAMIEMQTSRVLFARFAEELEGQGLDPALSAEMDRLFNLIDRFKNISDTRDMVRLEVEARGSSGVLSRLFGPKAGEIAKQLPGGGLNQNQTDRFVQDILDID